MVMVGVEDSSLQMDRRLAAEVGWLGLRVYIHQMKQVYSCSGYGDSSIKIVIGIIIYFYCYY